MKILSFDGKKGVMKVVPTNLDDLWVLYNVVLRDDVVYARSTREVKVEEEGARPTEGKRVPIFLSVRVEKKIFQRRSDRLRINGPVVEAPEKFGLKGSYHTITISVGKPITILKDEWLKHDIERVERATREETLPVLVVAIDDEEACVAILRQYDFEVKASIRARLPGKVEAEKREGATQSYFKEVLESLLLVWEETHGIIAVVGPGFWKDSFVKYIGEKRRDVAKDIALIGSVGSGGAAGAGEALRSGLLDKVSKEVRVIEETRAVEEVLSRLGSQRGDVSYGMEEVKKSEDYGAVELLLVADELLRDVKDEDRHRIESLLKDVEKTRGRIMIVDSENEAGKKLLGLGGIAALLRFTIR
ncbi:MAG: protein pelota [Thermoproteota archaeon]|nr:protein pelota [Thermoproteota archaeon]